MDTPTFRVAYLILSHQRPQQVVALAERILSLSPHGQVVVHHDAAAATTPWDGAPPPRVHLLARTRVLWGDWSMVETSLRLLRFAAEELDADWCAFLSGDDRPVVNLARWERTIQSAAIDGLVPATVVDRKPVFGRAPTAGDVNFVRYSYRWRELPPVSGLTRRAVALARRVSRYAQPLFKIEFTDRRDRFFVGVPRRRRLPPVGPSTAARSGWPADAGRWRPSSPWTTPSSTGTGRPGSPTSRSSRRCSTTSPGSS